MIRGLAACSMVLALASCAPSGDDAANRMSEWRPGAETYTVRYLEPPWQIGRTFPNGVLLRIPSNAEVALGLEGGVGKYELTVTTETGTAAARVAAERAAQVGMGHEIVVEPREITTDQGVVGMELVTFKPDATWDPNRRIAFIPLDSAQVIRLEFVATPSLDTAEVTAMIQLVTIADVGP